MGPLAQTPRFTCEFESQWDRLPDWLRAYLDADICRALSGTCQAHLLCSQTGIREVYGAMFVLYCADHDEAREVIFLDFKPRDPDTPEPPARDAIAIQPDEAVSIQNNDPELADINIFGQRRRNAHKPICMTDNGTGFEKQTLFVSAPREGWSRISTFNISIDQACISNPATKFCRRNKSRSMIVDGGVLNIDASRGLPKTYLPCGNSPANAPPACQHRHYSDSIGLFSRKPYAIHIPSCAQVEFKPTAFRTMKAGPVYMPIRSYTPA
jgi:hypothetical protein